MLLFVFILLSATRLKGKRNNLAISLLLSTLPANLYIIFSVLGWETLARIIYPFSYSVNTVMMPLLWLFVYANFTPNYSFNKLNLLHFLPAFVCVVLSALGCAVGNLNFIILSVQLLLYFFLIFRYMRHWKNYVRQYFSDAEWLQIIWIPRMMTLVMFFFLISIVCYFCFPDIDKWLYPLLNTLTMTYLVHEEIKVAHSQSEIMYKLDHELIPEIQSDDDMPLQSDESEFGFNIENFDREEIAEASESELSESERMLMEEYACKAVLWLEDTQEYINPNLSLNELAVAISVSPKKLSKAINFVLEKSFFDLVNGYRIEKSKILLLEKKERGLTLETIAEQCGFNSHYTYCRVFKKYMGMSTSKWVNSYKLTK